MSEPTTQPAAGDGSPGGAPRPNPLDPWAWLVPSTASDERARRAWARAVWDLPTDERATNAAADRRRMLQQLAESGGEVPEHFLAALDVLRGRPGSAHDFARQREDELHGLVDAFATEFFGLAPEERRRRWESLSETAVAYPSVRWRLAALEPGLAAPSCIEDEDPRASRIAVCLRAAFVQRGTARARTCRRFAEEVSQEREAWRKSLFRFRRLHPDVAALDPRLLERLSAGPRMPRPARHKTKGNLWPILLTVVLAATFFTLGWRSGGRGRRAMPEFKPFRPPTSLLVRPEAPPTVESTYGWLRFEDRLRLVETRDLAVGQDLRRQWMSLRLSGPDESGIMDRVASLDDRLCDALGADDPVWGANTTRSQTDEIEARLYGPEFARKREARKESWKAFRESSRRLREATEQLLRPKPRPGTDGGKAAVSNPAGTSSATRPLREAPPPPLPEPPPLRFQDLPPPQR